MALSLPGGPTARRALCVYANNAVRDRRGGARGMSRSHHCRWCGGGDGEMVLDLGDQPAADHFPAADDPGPDPAFPLQMWMCAGCRLAQLLVDPTVPREPRG